MCEIIKKCAHLQKFLTKASCAKTACVFQRCVLLTYFRLNSLINCNYTESPQKCADSVKRRTGKIDDLMEVFFYRLQRVWFPFTTKYHKCEIFFF